PVVRDHDVEGPVPVHGIGHHQEPAMPEADDRPGVLRQQPVGDLVSHALPTVRPVDKADIAGGEAGEEALHRIGAEETRGKAHRSRGMPKETNDHRQGEWHIPPPDAPCGDTTPSSLPITSWPGLTRPSTLACGKRMRHELPPLLRGE